jgi:hypothetical protein
MHVKRMHVKRMHVKRRNIIICPDVEDSWFQLE